MVGDSVRALGELEGKGRIYAVLDGARDPRVARLVVGSAPGWCLYRGKLPQELADAAPQLLELRPGHDYADTFFRVGWRNGWGVLLASAAPQPALYRHLRRMLLARSESGRSFVFRYYDPRVLRLYLPSCTAEEVERFLGPIAAVVAEAEEEGQFNVFRRAAAGFEHLRVERDAAPRPVRTWPVAQPGLSRGPLLLRQPQIDAMADPLVRKYTDGVVAWVAAEFPDQFEWRQESGVRALVARAITSAKTYRMTGTAETTGLLSLMLILGDDFEAREENAWMLKILRNEAVPPAQKVRMILEELKAI